jgi:SAM-dependent methyltransferase
MMEMLEDMAEAGTLHKEKPEKPSHDRATSFMDLGTGNGHLLFSLRDDGWTGHMLGVDYSAASIQLALQINESRVRSHGEEDAGASHINFLEHDLLSTTMDWGAEFHVLLDKGTFDAISLSEIPDATILYRRRIKKLMLDDAYLIITSCNWTEKELRAWIEGADEEKKAEKANQTGSFHFVDRVRYPSFRFGGQEGQTVVTLCFQIRRHVAEISV